jgi:aryl-alcohol dehydrogenase-like predicted oxidoreductase
MAHHTLNRIVFGCGNFGGLGSSPALRDKGDDRDRALALLDHARDQGLTRFDTANTYGGGTSERVLGEWLRRQGPAVRAGFQIATKVGNPNGCPEGDTPLSRTQLAFHLDESLRRLGLERIDLYYLHEFDPTTPIGETLEALGRALDEGKIAAFGVSNATLADLQAVLSRSTGRLRQAFTHVQNGFNLLEQRDLQAVIPLCRDERLQYVAFSPLSGGLLSGKYRPGEPPTGGRVKDAPGFYDHLLTQATFDAIVALRRQADADGTTVAGAALRFILDAPGELSLIIAPRSVGQFDDYDLGRLGAA